jgi:predicted Zn-dependent protease
VKLISMQKRPLALKNIARAAILFVAFAVLPALVSSQSSLPQLGDGQEMSVAAERQLGQRIAREIYRDPDYLDDPLIADYLQRIWQPLLQTARARGDITPQLAERFAWEVVLARDRTVNAFALPGGYMGVHLGLIAMVGNRDELASVMAHELSHVTQRHIARMTTQQNQLGPVLLGAMILGALAARKNSDVANAVITGSQAVSAQAQLNFSRDMEREADRVGYQVMQDAQFDVQGFVGMFDKLALANRINDNGSFPYLRTHPLTSERIGDMQARMQLNPPSGLSKATSSATPAQEADVLAIEHAIIATRARLLADPAVDYLRTELAQARRVAAIAPAPPGVTPQRGSQAKAIGQLYGGALAALKLRDVHTASSLVASAIQMLENDKNPLFTQANHARAAIDLIASEIAIAEGKHAKAQALLLPYVATLSPNGPLRVPPPSVQARAALLLWAQSVTKQPSADTALMEVIERLQSWVMGRPNDAPAWDALAGAYTAKNQPLRAIRAQAEARVALLDYTAALDRLKAGQELSRRLTTPDHIESSIIDARTRAVQLLVREMHSDKPLN